MKLICVLLSLFLLNSCDKVNHLKLVLDSYLGYRQTNLIQNFGKPDKITYSGSSKILEYEYVEHNFNLSPFDPKDPNNIANNPSLNNPGVGSIGNPILNNSILNGGIKTNGSGDVRFRYGEYQGGYSRQECQLRFTLDPQEIVRDWDAEGNACLRYANNQNFNREYIRDLPKIVDKTYGLKLKKSSQGLKVKNVHPLSSASQLGLREGDIISKINDLVTRNLSQEYALVELSKFSQVKLQVLRKKEILDLVVKKSDIPRLDLYNKKERKFMGF